MDRSLVPEELIKALYAGHKYLLCLQQAEQAAQDDSQDTVANQALLARHFYAWKEYTRLAISILEEDDGSEDL